MFLDYIGVQFALAIYRYYNTLKNELIELHCYHTDEELTSSIEEFAYGWYNHGRPHSYNDYRTPYEARCHS